MYTEKHEVTIMNGESLSNSTLTVGNKWEIKKKKILSVVVPSGFVGTELSIEASYDGVTYYPLYDFFNNEVKIPVTIGKLVSVEVANMLGFNFCKIRAGSLGTPSVQDADRNIIIGLGHI